MFWHHFEAKKSIKIVPFILMFAVDSKPLYSILGDMNKTENAEISWAPWRDLLSSEEMDRIAIQVRLIENGQITEEGFARFEALCDFTRSQRLFTKYQS